MLGRLVDDTALVPAHWPLEVVNTLVMAERRLGVRPPESDAFLDLLGQLDIQVDSAPIVPSSLLKLCRECSLTSYDAAYLDLAFRLQVPWATLDRRLQVAADTLGITVLGRSPG